MPTRADHATRPLDASLRWLERAKIVIPGVSQTLSKAPRMFTQGVYPIYLERGEGARVWDVDGNSYLDYPLALGPVSLGYAYPNTIRAVSEQLAKGSVFSLMHPLEVEVAELLCDVIPCAEMVRFAKNGADATTGAVRLARAVTGREHIACCGYHGFHDWYLAGTEQATGCPAVLRDYVHPFRYNELASLETIFSQHPDGIAAVILEPVAGELPEPGFLEGVEAITHRHGAVLIFDEIVTGFRLALGGAQEYYQVVPDLAAVGKGMANGLPISAVVGRRALMREFERGFFSTTYGGDCLALAAAKATIREMRESKVQAHYWTLGTRLQDGTKALIRRHRLDSRVVVTGLAPKSWIECVDQDGQQDAVLKGLFFQECIKRGILIGGLQYISFSHTQDDIDATLGVFDAAFAMCRHALESGAPERFLEGEPPGDVFRRSVARVAAQPPQDDGRR